MSLCGAAQGYRFGQHIGRWCDREAHNALLAQGPTVSCSSHLKLSVKLFFDLDLERNHLLLLVLLDLGVIQSLGPAGCCGTNRCRNRLRREA